MPEPRNIETGVDKLVSLVNKKKKVALNEAAKELGVSVPVVQEWADFLEDEGLISVEEMLNKTYLVEKVLNKSEVEKKTKEYTAKKDAFIAKVETAISSLKKESEGLDMVKAEFDKLKDAIGSDIDLVKNELMELKHYEELKKNMDKEILQQRLDYQTLIESVKKRIAEEKKKYESYLDAIGGEKSKIEEITVELTFLQKKTDIVQKRADALQSVVQGLLSEMDKQKALLAESLTNIAQKVKEAEKIRTELRGKIDAEIAPIMTKTKDDQEKVLAVQNAVLQKVAARHKEIDNYKLKSQEASDKLKAFFERRSNIQGMIEVLGKEKLGIEKELTDLVQKAKVFNLTIKSSDTKKYVKELQDGLKNVEKRRTGLREKLDKLTELLNKKDP